MPKPGLEPFQRQAARLLHARQWANAVRNAVIKPSQEAVLPHWTEALRAYADVEQLVEGMIDLGSFVLMYGQSGVGKSLLALDLCIAVVLGKDWRSRRVHKGAVAYFALEGGTSVAKRIEALTRINGWDLTQLPLFLRYKPLDFLSEPEFREVLQALAEMERRSPLALIVLDTVSRALAGGDENSAADMGTLQRRIDQIRQVTRAAVIAVHHTGKDSSRGARGHSLLRCGADTELELSPFRGRTLCKVTKQRDCASGDSFAFRIESRQWDDSERSCAVIRYEENELSDRAALALHLLKQAVDDPYVEQPTDVDVPGNRGAMKVARWQNEFIAAITSDIAIDSRKVAFRRALKKLTADGSIEISSGWAWPCQRLDGH